MDIIKEINKKFNNEYSFLKLYDVSYDKNSLDCVLTFLYPQSIENIPENDRKKIEDFIIENIKINGNISIKFKKSFLDNRLIISEIIKFINENYKAIAVYLSEKQIDIKEEDEIKKIYIHFGKEILQYFENSLVANKLSNYLNDKFISRFEINTISDEEFKIDDEIGEVEAPIIFTRNLRYKVFTVHKLFGGEIAPEPEFIKDNNEPKIGVILAGKVQEMQKKTFTRKKGKREGQEGIYYTFILNDDKKIDCVYFCPKSNIKKMDFISNDMTILCLGDIKIGLSGKLTYYIKKLSVATIDEESKKVKPKDYNKEHKDVVRIEDFIISKQENIFAKKIEYNDYILSNNFVVYDLETTGVDTTNDRIIEIGAVKIENGKVTKKFSTFVNPEIHIPDEASKVNNITDDMVADAPKINDVILDFLKFSKNCIISGYNNINFDNKFIEKVCRDLNLSFDNENADVFNIVRMSEKVHCKNYKLGTVCETLGISLEGAHRAYNDAYATAQILLKLNEIN